MLSELHATRSAASKPVRQYPRIPFSVPLTLRHLSTGGIQTTHGISLDISEGGLGAVVQGHVAVGEMFGIDFHLGAHPLNAVGIVRYVSSPQSGFEFLGLTAEERLEIGHERGRIISTGA